MLLLLAGMVAVGEARGEVAALWPPLAADDQPVMHDPALVTPESVWAFDPRLGELWLTALRREDALTRYQAADAIGRSYLQGFAAMKGATSALREVLEHDGDSLARLAAAAALVRLGDREGAGLLWRRNQSDGLAMLQLTDSVLAGWGFVAAEPVWRQRVNDRGEGVALRRSAAAALAVLLQATTNANVPDEAAHLRAVHAEMLRVVEDASEPATLRLAAAEAEATLAAAGRGVSDIREAVVAVAERLADGAGDAVGDDSGPLLAAALLAFPVAEPSLRATAVLERLLRSASGAVRGRATAAMILQDAAAFGDRLAGALAGDPDAGVRERATRFVAEHPSAARVAVLAARLSDPVPSVRRVAAEGLVGFAEDALLRPVVEEAVLARLSDTSAAPVATAAAAVDLQAWAAAASAAEVAGRLDLTGAGSALVQLLGHERIEVRAAAARALRRIASPDTLAGIAAEVERQVSQRASSSPEDDLVELVQVLGVMRHAESAAVLERLIPKNAPQSTTARAAAVWALGRLYEGDPAGGAHLTRPLVQRLSDEDMMNPEAPDVRRQAAVALGRMSAATATDALRRFATSAMSSPDLTAACYWALERITGEAPPTPETPRVESSDWFLIPLQ